MKKTLTLLFILFISLGILSAQNNEAETNAIKKHIAKSNKDIQNPKRKIKYKTWDKRTKIFMDAYAVNSKYLTPGLAANTIPLLGISESSPTPYYGKPIKIVKEGKFEVWNYPKVKIYVLNGVIDHWKDLAPIDTNALNIAYEALNKANELDKSGKFIHKKSTITLAATLRELILNKAIQYYNKNNFAEALSNIEKAINLHKYPRAAADTLVPEAAYYYYAGVFAFSDKNYKMAKKYFQKSLEDKYKIGTNYQYITASMYKLNDSSDAVKFLEQGAEKYPQETKIIYSLIDYYTPRGDYQHAFKYINKAISMTPENAILYIVKGSSYQKIYESIQKKYYENLNIADSLDKDIFRLRNTPKKQKEVIAKKEEVLKTVQANEKDLNNYKQKTIDAFKLGISKKQDPDYYYTIAYFYYKIAILDINEASHLRKLKNYITKLDNNASDDMKEAQKYAEKALELNPTDTYTMELLSKIYYRQGMYDKSSEMKKKILEQKNKQN